MKPNEKIIPEEKLLNLIRRPGSKESKQKDSPQEDVIQENKSSEATTQPKTHKEAVIKKTKNQFFGLKSLNFVIVNRLILALTLVVFFVLLIDLFSHSSIPPKSQSLKSAPKMNSSGEQEAKPYSYYEEEIAKRQLFSAPPMESKAKKVVPAGPTFKELVKDLKLLGIVSGDRLQVIVEDKKLNKTYFLYTGDYLGEIKVEEINSDRVVLDFQGERISLFL